MLGLLPTPSHSSTALRPVSAFVEFSRGPQARQVPRIGWTHNALPGLSARRLLYRRRLRRSGLSLRATENTEDRLASLEAENQRLRDQLASLNNDGAVEKSREFDGAVGWRLRGSRSESLFHFPETDLPWPPDQIRLADPGEPLQRDACGDWLTLFRNAAPYIASFRGGTVVVHLPSFLLNDADIEDQETFRGIMEDVAFCSLLGLSIVLVTSIECRFFRRLQQERGDLSTSSASGPAVGNSLPAGLCVDQQALQIAKQEAGFARVEVESALSAGFQKRSLGSADGDGTPTTAGIFPLRGAVSVVSSLNFFTAAPLGVRDGVDYGYAGVPRSVNTELLERRLNDGDIVALTPLGASPSGQVFYVSSEALAAQVATKLKAMKLVYVTRGQRLVSNRGSTENPLNAVIAGVQVRNAAALLKYLEDGGLQTYPEEVRSSDWFKDTLRQLRLLVKAVSPKGVRRGHLVDPIPGALLQEFYTTDGSGTCIAQDLYQGLGTASVADAGRIVSLLEDDAARRGGCRMPGTLREAVQVACAREEFFVWRRDEVVLGCGQLVALTQDGPLVAELRYFAVVEQENAIQALALFGYAEQAAICGGAKLLAVQITDCLSMPVDWFEEHGFREPKAGELDDASSDGRQFLLKPLNADAAAEAAEFVNAFSEEERMWGGVK